MNKRLLSPQRDVRILSARGAQAGWGHWMRCSTLKRALERSGWHVLGMHDDQAEFVHALERDGESKPDWVVLDRYDLTEAFERDLKARGLRVLTIADGPTRQYAADVLLDPNLSDRTEISWRSHCHASTRILCGGRFLLLREEFWLTPSSGARQAPELAQSFLISMGATDPAGLSFLILDAFAALHEAGSDMLDGARVIVIAGRENPRADELKAKCEQLPWAEFVLHADQMRPYLEAADLCIGAAGQSTWERFASGAPALVAAVAENQRHTLELMAGQGLVFSLGWHEQITAAAAAGKIEQAARSRSQRQYMSDEGPKQLGQLEFLQNPIQWLET